MSELPSDPNSLTGGDLNAHTNMWDEWQSEDPLGTNLEEWLLAKDFCVANDGSATRTNPGTGGSSAPDVTLVHKNILDRVEWSTIASLGSDHLPVLVIVDCQISSLNSPSKTELKWNWNKANFHAFGEEVDEAILAESSSLIQPSLDARSKFLTSAILKAATSTIGKIKRSKNGKEWLTRDIREAVKRRNCLRKEISSKRREWVESCKTVREMIKASKEDRWKSFLEDSESSADPYKIWATIKSLSGRSPCSIKNETLIHDGREYSTNRGKADAFLRRYAEISSLNIPKACSIKNSVRRSLNTPTVEDESSTSFTKAELTNAITSMKAKGAPGKDMVHPRFLKALGPTTLNYLLDMFNESWHVGYCPSSWREAVMVSILKKGKPASSIDSFRPISLTSCIAKTFERMIATRLSFLAESKGWWCNEQAGFRAMRSCEDQTLRLSQSISDGFLARPAKRTVLALLDFRKAYDKIWRDKLIEIMIKAGVSRTMARWIRGFLCDRKACVRIDGTIGSKRKLKQGVPQGSVLSPLLFLFYIDGIRETVPEGVKISMYADDIAIWAQDPIKTEAKRKVQLAVAKISAWSKAHKLILNPLKCESSFFSTDTHEAK